MTGRFTVVKEFGFEAAHHFPHKPAGHENTRIHGHSFRVEVAVVGEPDSATGCVVDFEALGLAVDAIRRDLDHHMLNDLPGLGIPSLENLARWIAERLKRQFPTVSSVTVKRPTLGEAARFDAS